MKILFCGGGTGGHITPALSMADILRQNDKTAEFLFVGREGGRENDAIKNEGHELRTLRLRGFRRSLSPSNIEAVKLALRARRRAKDIIRDFSPDLVVGTGGYVSFPVLSAAGALGIKRAIHESNAYPGAVTRLLAPRVEIVMLGYSAAAHHLSPRASIALTGNPVRSSVGQIPRTYARARLGIDQRARVVLSIGGSLGARAINEAVRELFEIYRKDGYNVLHIHATGRGEYPTYAHLSGEDARMRVIPYIEDMPLYLAAADLAITRCGAMTLAELCAQGVPAILIPSPNVTANHQYENARALSDAGGAILITEGELSAPTLYGTVKKILENSALKERMSAAQKSLDARGAADKIYKELKKLLNG